MTADAIEVTVDQELRRRKRNLRMFMLLLLVPIVTGIAALTFSSRQAAPDVRPLVRQEVQRTLEPQIATQVSAQISAQVAPMVEKNVQEQVAKNVAPLEGQYKKLDARVTRISRPVMMTVQPDAELKSRIEALSKQVESLTKEVEALKSAGALPQAASVKKPPQ
jgi:uncharacterized membrane protein